MYSAGYYPIPDDETRRLACLNDYGVYRRPPEREFDRITRLGAHVFDVPICLISIMGETDQWFAAREGIGSDSGPRDAAFCSRTIMMDEPLVVLDAAQDAGFRDNPLVTGDLRIRFYAGAPLIVDDGICLGALCLIDRVPHGRFDIRQRKTLEMLASIVAERLMRRRDAVLGRRATQAATRACADMCDALGRQLRDAATRQAALSDAVNALQASHWG